MQAEALFIQAALAKFETDQAQKALAWIEKDWFVSSMWQRTVQVAKELMASGLPPSRDMILSSSPWAPEQEAFLRGLDLEAGRGVQLKPLAVAIRQDARNRAYQSTLAELAVLDGMPEDKAQKATEALAKLSLSMQSAELKVEWVDDSMRKSQVECLTPYDNSMNVVHLGIPVLDTCVRMTRRSLGVIAAITSAGKSTLAIQAAAQSALQGRRSVIVSLEMGVDEVHAKAISHMTQTSAWTIQTVPQPDLYSETHFEAGSKIGTICAGSGASWMPIEAQLRGLHAVKPLDVVFVDYLTLLEAPEANKSANLAQRYGELSKAMRRLSQDLKICVVMICQFNRQASEGAEPHLTNLRETGQIENDANWAILLWNEDRLGAKPGDTRKVRYKVAKNRGGRRGDSGTLEFDPSLNVFRSASV